MHNSRITSIIACTVAALAMHGSARADHMYAVDPASDSLYVLDTDTGATIDFIGPLHPLPTRFTEPRSMAVSTHGRIFILNDAPDGDRGLSRVNPVLGFADHIGGDVTGSISFGPGGMLYGIDPLGRLGFVDTGTGNVTPIGGPPLPQIFGLDFNRADGFFYGVTKTGSEGQFELLQISPLSGLVISTTTLALRTTTQEPGSIAFERDGTLVLTVAHSLLLWEVDIVTGAMQIRAFDLDGPTGLGLIPCRADFDGNGVLDIFDFLAFQNAFDAGDLEADFDGDGVLTIFDFLAFQNAFDAGC